MERFEWDEAKNRETIRTRGIDFNDIVSIFDGPIVNISDTRHDYGESRFIAFGECYGHVFAVVYTIRGDRRRLISARRARHDEREKYFAAVAAEKACRPD